MEENRHSQVLRSTEAVGIGSNMFKLLHLLLALAIVHCAYGRFFNRASWGARPSKRIPTPIGRYKQYVFIHHTTGNRCNSVTACKARARQTQNYHMDTKRYDTVGYSFLVGDDGNVYEGRGWGIQGAHTLGYNTQGYGISVIGNFQSQRPSTRALNAVKVLIQQGVRGGYLRSTYILRGHRDMKATACPGQKLYDIIKTWPHY